MVNMFHTFETAQYTSPNQQEANATAAAKRRTSTLRACEPCRRRKIRCNGEHPCETCQWYRKAASCHYTEPRQRQVPSRRSVEKISQTLQEYRAILQKLFPNFHPEQLAGMPREKLIDLISRTGPFQAPSPVTPGQEEIKFDTNGDSSTLEQLQPLPEELEDVFREEGRARTFSGPSEEISALSLTGKESSSYLGISSVMAVLRVILWLDPECQTFVAPNANVLPLPVQKRRSTPLTSGLPSSATSSAEPNPSAWSEPSILDAYFQYVHPATPLVDEQIVRDTYITGDRTDSRWLLLINSILAVGSIAAATSAASTIHEYYFTLAREQLTVDTLGSAHIETVQALALLSGYYLHYIQETSLASTIMGATLRMSTVLGLHRDFCEGLGSPKDATNSAGASSKVELRRRIWWSIFMLDAWAGSTLGRPSMGRMSRAVTAKLPQESFDGSEADLQLMQESARFCQISTRLEDSLATSPTMNDVERETLDAALSEWYQQSSVVLQQASTSGNAQYHSPSSTTSAVPNQADTLGTTLSRNLMRWRYHLSRIILHRPALLWWSMRSHRQSTTTKPERPPVLDDSRRAAIELCRLVTFELITDICANWSTAAIPPSAMSAWQATSLLYQAVMVPLLSLFSESQDEEVTHQARQLIQISIDALGEMQRWCKVAKRSLEVVSTLYAASRRRGPQAHATMQMMQEDLQVPDESDTTSDRMGVDSFGVSSENASVSESLASGGLDTPITLPSTVSTSSRLQQQQQQQQHHHVQYQPQADFHQPQQQRPTFIDLPPLSVAPPFPQPTHQLPSQHQQIIYSTPTTHSSVNMFMHPHAGTTPSASSTSANSNSAYLESSTTNLLDSLTWSQGWTDTNYPFETPRLGWDPCAMHGWVGGIDPDAGGGYEYFAGAGAGGGEEIRQR